jgi:hypothetical protein
MWRGRHRYRPRIRVRRHSADGLKDNEGPDTNANFCRCLIQGARPKTCGSKERGGSGRDPPPCRLRMAPSSTLVDTRRHPGIRAPHVSISEIITDRRRMLRIAGWAGTHTARSRALLRFCAVKLTVSTRLGIGIARPTHERTARTTPTCSCDLCCRFPGSRLLL